MSKLEVILEQNSLVFQDKHKEYTNALGYCLSTLNEVNDVIRVHQFTNIEEEIYFFKYTKTVLEAKIIYFQKLHLLESNKIIGSSEFLDALNQEIKVFQRENKELCLYHKLDKSHYDGNYFVRYQLDHSILISEINLVRDTRTDSFKGHLFAKIIAFEMLDIEINQKHSENLALPKLTWTSKKVHLIELIYALQSTKSINDGNATLSQLKSAFMILFDLDKLDMYNGYQDIKGRDQYDVFSEMLSNSINKRVDDDYGLK